jgi:hypothetical protein
MFPDYDSDVLSSILAMAENNVESAIEQLLEMGGSGDGGGGGGGGVPDGASGMDADEELAMALFQQFAIDLEGQLGEPIPADVRADPARYEEFVRTHFARQMERGGGGDVDLAQRAESLIARSPTMQATAQRSRGGMSGFLDRFRRGAVPIRGSSTRVKVVAVGGSSSTPSGDMRAGLLDNADQI